MELILERELEHQQKAVSAIVAALDGVHISKPSLSYENPSFDRNDATAALNILRLQKEIRSDHRGCHDNGDYLNLDIRMETGTGKTYVYTQTIHELHQKYGFNKFIIAVPSLAIKAGTKQFITDNYVRHHFSDICGYNCDIELNVLESPKKQKKGFLAMPSAVRDFVTGSCQNTNKIFVLLVNMQLLTNGNMLTRSDYDYLVEGFYRPFDALRATKPILLIDEPHRFSRDQKAFTAITKELEPQTIIRFGATFPEITIGRGKSKITYKDYNNLIYELDACNSFNQNLIKGVAKEHFEPLSAKEEKVKLVTIVSKTSATFHFKKRGEDTKTHTMSVGDSLSVIDLSLEGITITAIGKNYIELSNGQTKFQGEEFNTDIYSSSYQEQMIKLALQRHFETERQNFCGRQYKIKTLALFFIDDITSYRDKSEDGKEPYLKIMFERLLLEKTNELLDKLPESESEYREYLLASKADIRACHAGYFSQDNSDSDDLIAKEVDDILHNKKGLISLHHEDGSYNTRRFLFSKWTLKEGWDNPNVFTIVKLRSSGSETSKLQEVGRGLRLPVNENGNRISNEEFRLNYIVDFTEADFAQKLVDEINGELPNTLTISPAELDRVAKKLNIDPDDLFGDLLGKKYINRNCEIRSENRDVFFAEYPEFASGVSSGKVTDNNKNPAKPVKVRKAVYSELKSLWEAINQKYFLFYDIELETEIPKVIHNILRHNVFGNVAIKSERSEVASDGKNMYTREGIGVSFTIERPIPYNEFLKRISVQTSVPITVLHSAIIELSKEKPIIAANINEFTATNIVRAFVDWRIENTQGRFRYTRSALPVTETVLSYRDGTPREQIVQGKIGTKFVEGTPCEKYLYDTIAFDSPLEKDNIVTDIEEVIVYGKIPRTSISIPTIAGENYNPDFMYVIKKSDGTKELNIVVETKLVEGKSNLRGVERAKISCAEAFFQQMSIYGYKVSFHTQLSNKKVKQIIDDVINA